ncbi:1336_t:CDS:1, partial [Paraglomus occultum]
MKRQLEQPDSFSVSSMNSTKRLKLVNMYNIKTAIQFVSFDKLLTIGFEPGRFIWDNSHIEDWHSRAYTDYIRTDFLGLEYLKNHVVLNISQNKSYFDAPYLRGTAD